MKQQRKKPQFDQVDFEAMKSLTSGEVRGWSMFKHRLLRMLENKLRDLEREMDHEKTIVVRAEVRQLRAILDIPDILLAEARTGAEAQRESEE